MRDVCLKYKEEGVQFDIDYNHSWADLIHSYTRENNPVPYSPDLEKAASEGRQIEGWLNDGR